MHTYKGKIANKTKNKVERFPAKWLHLRMHIYTYNITRKLKITFQKSAKVLMGNLYTGFNNDE